MESKFNDPFFDANDHMNAPIRNKLNSLIMRNASVTLSDILILRFKIKIKIKKDIFSIFFVTEFFWSKKLLFPLDSRERRISVTTRFS